MVISAELEPFAEIHFEGDSKDVLSGFPTAMKATLGFALRQIQKGEEVSCGTRPMPSVGPKVFELKEGDEATWYRVMFLAKIGNTIHVLHAFRKSGRKTDKRDIAMAKTRLSAVNERLRRERANEKRIQKQAKPRS